MDYAEGWASRIDIESHDVGKSVCSSPAFYYNLPCALTLYADAVCPAILFVSTHTQTLARHLPLVQQTVEQTIPPCSYWQINEITPILYNILFCRFAKFQSKLCAVFLLVFFPRHDFLGR